MNIVNLKKKKSQKGLKWKKKSKIGDFVERAFCHPSQIWSCLHKWKAKFSISKVWKSESNWDEKSQCELEFFDCVIKDLREAFPWLFGSFCLDELTLPQPHIMGLNHIFISIYICVHLAIIKFLFCFLRQIKNFFNMHSV